MTKDSLTVKTQLVPPRLKRNVLRREKLLESLKQNLDRKLILIMAGAGYGKTTLLSEFVSELQKPFVFYTIGKNDGSLLRFVTYLITGIQEVYKRFGVRTRSVLEGISSGAPDTEMLMGTLVNELLDAVKGEFFIILEDYHLVDKTELINEALDYLLEHIPSNIHFVISSRTVPPLSIARIRAKGELLELTNENLRFKRDEIQRLFADIYKQDIPESLMEKMEHRFEGWVTALQLMSYLTRRDPKRALDELERGEENISYFQSEVFEQQSEKVRSFLVKSCMLERLTAKSCNAILGIDDSQEILEDLLKKNLFVSYTDERKEVFCYHQLFRSFLLDRQSREGNERSIRSLHLKAADWFKRTGEYSRSIEHYLLAREAANAGDLVEREADRVMQAGRFDVLEQWMEELPDRLIQTRPMLLLFQGRLLYWEGKWDEALESYKKARYRFTREGKKEESARAMYGIATVLINRGAYVKGMGLGKKALGMIGDKSSETKADILNLVSVVNYYMGRTSKAISAVSEGLRVLKDVKDYSESRFLVMYHNLLVYSSYIGKGDETIEKGEQLVRNKGNSLVPRMEWIHITLGHTYLFKGETVKARNAFRKALKISKTYNNRIGMVTTLNELGLYYLVVGKPEVSRLYYGRVLKRSLAVGEKPRKIYALAGMGETYLSEGNLTKAEEYADKAIVLDEENWAHGSLLSMKGQIKLGLGNLKAAGELLSSALEDISKAKNLADLMSVHIALAKLYYKKGEENLLIEHLKKAMELSKKYDYHYILIRLSRINSFLLRFAIRNHIQPHYAQFLLGQVPAGYDIMASCFGGLKIKSRAGETKDIKWKRQKAKSLFCYLLANRGKRFTPDQLMEVLWPEKSLSKSQTSLWNALLCVRSVTGSLVRKGTPFIEHKDGCYGIDDKCKVWCDFEEFDRLMIEARQWETRGNERMAMTAYESVFGLYEGDFLVEMYDLWMDEKRLYYKEQHLRALEKMVVFYMKEQRFEKAIQLCNRVISVDEFRESSYLMAMQAHTALGNRKSAIDLYERLKKVLDEELGFKPSSEAEDLLKQLSKDV